MKEAYANRARVLDQLAHGSGLVGREVVDHDGVAAAQAGDQPPSDPVLMASQPVAIVTQPSIRMAPTIVRSVPQFIGRGSISSGCRGAARHASVHRQIRARFVEEDQLGTIGEEPPHPVGIGALGAIRVVPRSPK